MTTAQNVKEAEAGLVRLYVLDQPPEEALLLQETPHAITLLLGQDGLDLKHVELFDLADLQGIGLRGYLAEGHGIEADVLAEHALQLDGLTGVVLILRSAAVIDRPTTLAPKAPLRWVATFGEQEAPPAQGAPLESDGAKGSLAQGAPADASSLGSASAILLALFLICALGIILWLVL